MRHLKHALHLALPGPHISNFIITSIQQYQSPLPKMSEQLSDAQDIVRTAALLIDAEIAALNKEKQEKYALIREFPGKGVDAAGFPEADYPHLEIACAKARIGEIADLLGAKEEELSKKMALYFAMDVQ